MTDGIFINNRRPKSKKEVKEAVNTNPESVVLEATSLFDSQGNKLVTELDNGKYSFVGPDPYNARNFYGTITVANGKIKVT